MNLLSRTLCTCRQYSPIIGPIRHNLKSYQSLVNTNSYIKCIGSSMGSFYDRKHLSIISTNRQLNHILQPSSEKYNSMIRFTTTDCSKEEKQLSNKDKLKRAVKEYGSTVIVFHVAISLASLGICYVLVDSGVDVGKLLGYIGISAEKFSTSAGTFVAAYAVHKVFAPARIFTTLSVTPFIVRYLRNIGFLKK